MIVRLLVHALKSELPSSSAWAKNETKKLQKNAKKCKKVKFSG